jgi:hypothetical protein
MIEFTVTEFVLLCWAVLATGYAFMYKHEQYKADVFIRAILDDAELRNHLVDDYNKFKGSVESQ